MCRNPAILCKMTKRGFIKKEGYYADLTLVDLNSKRTVTKDNLLYKCGWSPLVGTTFQTEIKQTFVNENLVYKNGIFFEQVKVKEFGIRIKENTTANIGYT